MTMRPFTKAPGDRLSHLGEVGLIKKIREWLGDVGVPPPAGIGDDCAVVPPSSEAGQLLTVDSLSYGQHFDATVSPEQAGAKLVKRNLSDIAAMGGMPGPAVLALLCGPDVSARWLGSFFEGVRETCRRHGVRVVGGDISSLPPGHFSSVLTLTGTARHPKLRSSARVGDSIYVTGSLGGSILEKHYAFEPRLEQGRWLAAHSSCTALMDLTDGLAKDLPAILPDGGAAALDMDRVPVSGDAVRVAEKSGRTPMEHAFCDGEDYELLFTLAPGGASSAFEASWAKDFPELRLTALGTIQAHTAGKIILDQRTNEVLPWTRGFEHLKD